MKYAEIINGLKKILEERFPEGYNYVPLLAKILNVHPKTVFRKLNGVSLFTLEEMATISTGLDLQIDSIFSNHKSIRKHPLDIYIHDYTEDNNCQYISDMLLINFESASKSPSSQFMVATNSTPAIVNLKHAWITRFNFLKWIYFNKGSQSMVTLSDINFSDWTKNFYYKFQKSIDNMHGSKYIYHIDMIKHIGDEIRFFYGTNFITEEEAMFLLDDYDKFLDILETLCTLGSMNTAAEVDIFYSTILLSNDIAIVDSDNIKFAIIYAFSLNPILTKNNDTFEIIKKWYHSWIRSSNIISMSGATQRYLFFKKQRDDLTEIRNAITAYSKTN